MAQLTDIVTTRESLALGLPARTLDEAARAILKDIGPIGAGGSVVDLVTGSAKIEASRYREGLREGLNIGEVLALWVEAKIDAAEERWNADMNVILATDLIGTEYVTAQAPIARRRQRALNAATKAAYGVTFTDFLAACED